MYGLYESPHPTLMNKSFNSTLLTGCSPGYIKKHAIIFACTQYCLYRYKTMHMLQAKRMMIRDLKNHKNHHYLIMNEVQTRLTGHCVSNLDPNKQSTIKA